MLYKWSNRLSILYIRLNFYEFWISYKFTKKIYFLKIFDFKNMSKFFIYVKIFMKKIIVTNINFSHDKQIIIYIMIILKFRFQNLIQIWNAIFNLIAK